jgi:hypothetical protein
MGQSALGPTELVVFLTTPRDATVTAAAEPPRTGAYTMGFCEEEGQQLLRALHLSLYAMIHPLETHAQERIKRWQVA